MTIELGQVLTIILGLLVGATQAIGVKALFRLVDRLDQIREHLAQLNGSVRRCDSLRVAHEEEAKRLDNELRNRIAHLEREHA